MPILLLVIDREKWPVSLTTPQRLAWEHGSLVQFYYKKTSKITIIYCIFFVFKSYHVWWKHDSPSVLKSGIVKTL